MIAYYFKALRTIFIEKSRFGLHFNLKHYKCI
jgi:hypothetical protein